MLRSNDLSTCLVSQSLQLVGMLSIDLLNAFTPTFRDKGECIIGFCQLLGLERLGLTMPIRLTRRYIELLTSTILNRTNRSPSPTRNLLTCVGVSAWCVLTLDYVFPSRSPSDQRRCALELATLLMYTLVLLLQSQDAIVFLRSLEVEIVFLGINDHHRVAYCSSDIICTSTSDCHVGNQVGDTAHLVLFTVRTTRTRRAIRLLRILNLACLTVVRTAIDGLHTIVRLVLRLRIESL